VVETTITTDPNLSSPANVDASIEMSRNPEAYLAKVQSCVEASKLLVSDELWRRAVLLENRGCLIYYAFVGDERRESEIERISRQNARAFKESCIVINDSNSSSSSGDNDDDDNYNDNRKLSDKYKYDNNASIIELLVVIECNDDFLVVDTYKIVEKERDDKN
jgi:hypothetical protein